MKKTIQFIIAIVLISTFAACGENKADANKGEANQPTSLPAADRPVADTPVEAKLTIPQGTKLHVVLIDGLSTTKNKPGDPFTASLAAPVTIDETTVLE